ncbi:substrate-binding periplasmic protein [Pseudomonas chlororaphis]|uniref:substrate-binding periplasmic protein n=1 Tax=Pseudomonas chlororaphis TaxID=587753 RepID=UPI001B310D9E|nr:transporter substrate-binding domain-containing protein [Pseudomonas chlororaphis]MBP5077959.1 transporter substrate-binding domain-containing protein [Pseudomonas chlororaphis]QTT91791.1 transporter substrate-binding domain-containing protein [Pseudomonas chlororaphis]
MIRPTPAKSTSFFTLLLLPLLLSIAPALKAHESLEFLIPDAPPLTMVNQGDRHGIVGDIVLRALKNSGYASELRNLPWARAQKYALEKDNVLIAPLSRTPEREDRYTWIAPIMQMDRAFFSLEHKVTSFEEARRRFKAIAVGLGSAQEEILRSKGFAPEQIYAIKIGENPAQLLLKGRVDAWFNGVQESRYIWQRVSNRPLLMSPPLVSHELYLACSKVCSAEIVSHVAKAIETMRRDGYIEKVKGRYLNNDPLEKSGSL